MTLVRLREIRNRADGVETTSSQALAETRGASLTSWPSGFGWNDPAAIPPPGLFSMQRAGVPVTPHTSLQIDAVFTSLRIICGAIVDFGNLRAYKTKLDKVNIPYREWLEKQPNILQDTWVPGMMQYDGMERTVMSMGMFGEAFWYILERDKLGYPSMLEVLHPSFMNIEPDRTTGKVVYEYGMPGDRHRLDPENVVHIPKLALPGAVRGLSSIEYGGVVFAIALAAMEYGQRWFAQGASPSYILQTKGKLNPSELQRVAEKFLYEHAGLSNAHLPLILDNGMEAKQMQATPDQAQYLQTLEFARSAVFDWFGIPLFLRNNALERNTPEPPGTIQERSVAFLRFALTGYTQPLQEAFTTILPANVNAAYDTSEFTRADAKSLATEILTLRNSQVASVNDIRVRKLGWEPVDDPQADEVMLPLASNVAPSQTKKAAGSKHDPEVDPSNEPDDEI